METPVEETKDLVALHNLTEDKLLKSIALGGFPMPSIAVTRQDIPHTDFGDITLDMDKGTIDPKASRILPKPCSRRSGESVRSFLLPNT